MIRKDKEITDFAEMLDILKRCDTVHIGMTREDGGSYVLPVSFGADVQDGKAVIYFHGAGRGLKTECLRFCSEVSMTADIFYKIETTEIGITTRYESVMGRGTVSIVSDEGEKVYGLKCILSHYGFDDYPAERCRGLVNTTVYKLVLDEMTGKTNLKGHAGVKL